MTVFRQDLYSSCLAFIQVVEVLDPLLQSIVCYSDASGRLDYLSHVSEQSMSRLDIGRAGEIVHFEAFRQSETTHSLLLVGFEWTPWSSWTSLIGDALSEEARSEIWQKDAWRTTPTTKFRVAQCKRGGG